jgi:aldose 1-epimerase
MQLFGHLNDGREVLIYTLKNKNGLLIKAINWGGAITSITTPDRNGNLSDIVLGYDDLVSYVNDFSAMGTIIGRYANRIYNSSFILDGIKYDLFKNNGENCLHGGKNGFNKVFWDIEEISSEDSSGLSLKYYSKDNEEGFPGNLEIKVEYLLTDDNSLIINYFAKSDKNTIFNPTQHTYFNLSGEGGKDILEHTLKINSQYFLPSNSVQIPTGEFANIKSTPFDFSEFKKIGQDINSEDEQLKIGNGYDQCWILKTGNSHKLIHAGILAEPDSGRKIEIFTTEPGIQVYTGNHFDGLKGKKNIIYMKHAGIALETQHFPDSPNQLHFPSVILKQGEEFRSQTIYKFGII